MAIDPTEARTDIVTPGHVFPLVAQDGGVLVRAGHTEAAVDISRLAGLNPSGVICEIMNDDGTMARLPDLVTFAQAHGLKIATIADLIAYRRRKEKLVEKVAETTIDSRFGGRFHLKMFANSIDYAEHLALVCGDVTGDEPVLVRMHEHNLLADSLGDATPDHFFGGESRDRAAANSILHAHHRREGPGRRRDHPRADADLSAAPSTSATASRPASRSPSCASTASARRSCWTWVCRTSSCCRTPNEPSSGSRATGSSWWPSSRSPAEFPAGPSFLPPRRGGPACTAANGAEDCLEY